MSEPSVEQRFARARANDDLVVLEGFHALKHALRFEAELELVVTSDGEGLERLARDLAPDLAGRLGTLAQPIAPERLAGLAARAPRTQVLAIAHRRPFDPAALSPRPIVLLEDPRDLGNVGAVVRVAAAADVAAVLTTGTVDPWDAAALRGSAGLHYALPVAPLDGLDLSPRPLLALDPEGEPLRPAELPRDAVLAFGTERHGLSDELLARADRRIRIPMRPGVSSLNLATSVAAVLFAWLLADS
jgi:TrmH family RNA methyltransferase